MPHQLAAISVMPARDMMDPADDMAAIRGVAASLAYAAPSIALIAWVVWAVLA